MVDTFSISRITVLFEQVAKNLKDEILKKYLFIKIILQYTVYSTVARA